MEQRTCSKIKRGAKIAEPGASTSRDPSRKGRTQHSNQCVREYVPEAATPERWRGCLAPPQGRRGAVARTKVGHASPAAGQGRRHPPLHAHQGRLQQLHPPHHLRVGGLQAVRARVCVCGKGARVMGSEGAMHFG